MLDGHRSRNWHFERVRLARAVIKWRGKEEEEERERLGRGREKERNCEREEPTKDSRR